jgi:uncharacterized protein YegL
MHHIISILDRSGSMASIVNDAIGGFNTFLISQQAEPGEAIFSLVLFDHDYLPVHTAVPIQSVPPLDRTTFIPRGNTALLDAIGKTIDNLGQQIIALPKSARPEKVIICILTDGEENASRQYPAAKIKQQILHHRELLGWEFIFLAANQDAILGATALGIAVEDAVHFDASPAGAQAVMQEKARLVSQKRRLKI